GLHGMEFNDVARIKREHAKFQKLSGLENFGIRMHYIRCDENTLGFLSQTGYTYDTTECAFRDPYRIGAMREFPFQIMDGWIIENYKKWQALNLEEAKENTLKILDKAEKNNLQYLGIDFHDRYFSHAFKTWLEWYI